jgi:hypothetical protein
VFALCSIGSEGQNLSPFCNRCTMNFFLKSEDLKILPFFGVEMEILKMTC